MPLVATGAGSVQLVGLERRTPSGTTGVPLSYSSPIAAPSAPTTAAGGGTGITGEVVHRLRAIVLGRGRTAATAACAALTVSNKNIVVTITPHADTSVYGYQIERAILTKTEDHTAVTGLEDAAFASTSYTGEPNDYWEVEITGNGTPDVFRWRKNGGSWTTGVNISGSAQTLSYGVTVTFTATTGHQIGDVWRYTVSGTWAFIGYSWGRTTTTYTDTTAVGSEPAGYTLPSADETAALGGLVGITSEPAKVFEVSVGRIESKELTQSVGKSQSIPGRLGYMLDVSADLTIGKLAPALASFGGAPSSAVASGIQTLTFAPSDEETARVSLWGVYMKGGGALAVTPYLWMGGVYNDIEMSGLGGNTIGNVKLKGMACGDSEFGPGIPDSGNSGTCVHAPVIKGMLAEDYDAYTSVWTRVTEAPTPYDATWGTVKWQIRATESGATTDVTMWYRLSDGVPVVRGTLEDVYVEGLDASALPWGPDDTNNLREPLSVSIACVTGLALDDTWEHYRPVPRPGSGLAPTYWGDVVRSDVEGVFGASSIQFLRGSSSADTWLRANLVTVKMSRQLDVAYYAGAAARRPGAVRTVGPLTLEVMVDQDFDSREFERYARWNKALIGQLNIAGGRIRTQPGVRSTTREGLTLDAYRMEIIKVENAVSGDGAVVQKLTFAVTRRDDPSLAPYQIVTRSARTWDFSAAATAA